ncbi:hypothetical protein Cpap_0457 [Ruminiclostridium papyrosolvens DSM 2782]|uniref:Uncharacterized protein n=1 Tax=Ruminiclostridium papyrosolvens DSM 2782 TaxID=588581 RepID=F1THG0_9FIRM|nr:hypothetical protein Cpap_0457 [Ruminiclostridium papyrosolvens DSM 2782]
MSDKEQVLLNAVQEIIYTAKSGNDILKFGAEAADILEK